ncbi:hypothetical protein T10_5956 [Trichinella papuae]|uniref:Uncharacterized protein n=1 Tax=Trichinella papuae TaxID=268474 RepID=A0A0V1MU65_9BILA|nr:hypothetical protein T10_5956 [Trichinella papuae]
MIENDKQIQHNCEFVVAFLKDVKRVRTDLKLDHHKGVIKRLENECRSDASRNTKQSLLSEMVITIHRVSEDLATTIVDNNQFSMRHHCPTEDNPADMLSRRYEQHPCSLKKLEEKTF